MSPPTARRWPPTEPPPGGEDEQLWAAVAEPSRRRVLDAILAHGAATPTLLARELPVSRQAITKHLAVLERAHLVAGQRQGREVRYVVDPQRLALATAILARQAARWDQRLAAVKRIAETLHAAIAADDPPAPKPSEEQPAP
jgi:DNA-binding transcriptional ArsR family regulator